MSCLVSSPVFAGPDAAARSPWAWTALEVSFHGLSVALVDSTPRELMQVNLRRCEMRFVSSGHGVKYALTLGSLSIDNLMADTFNPVVLCSHGTAGHVPWTRQEQGRRSSQTRAR